MTVRRLIVVVSLLAAVLYTAAHAVCQHRAEYGGGLVFVGRPVNVFGTEYYRVYMWRAADDTSPLPDAGVSIDGVVYELSALTPEVLAGGEAPRNEGGGVDSAGARIQYRFEGGRLTWFSIDADMTGASTPTTNGRYTTTPTESQRYNLSINSGRGFALPLRRDALIEYGGRPERSYLYFAQ